MEELSADIEPVPEENDHDPIAVLDCSDSHHLGRQLANGENPMKRRSRGGQSVGPDTAQAESGGSSAMQFSAFRPQSSGGTGGRMVASGLGSGAHKASGSHIQHAKR